MKTKQKNIFKRITSFVLTLLMVLTLMPVGMIAHADDGSEGYTYSLKFRQSKPDPGYDAYDGDHLDVPKSYDNYAGGKKLLITATVLDAAGSKTKATDSWVGLTVASTRKKQILLMKSYKY